MLTTLTPAKIVFLIVNLGFLSSMIAAWGWVVYRIATRQRLLPSAPLRSVPWGGKTVLAILLSYIALQMIVPVIYIKAMAHLSPGVSLREGAAHQIVVTVCISLPFLAIAWTILTRSGSASARDFGLESRRVPIDVLRGILAWPILAPIVFGMYYAATRIWADPVKHPIEAWARQNPSLSAWAMIFFAAVVVAPLTEEFLFRGVLLGWLNRIATGRSKPDRIVVDGLAEPWEATPTDGESLPDHPSATPIEPEEPRPSYVGLRLFLANLMVSFVFAMMHAQVWPSPIPLFLLAMALGVLYQRTGSLIAPIALHMTFNGISTGILYLASLSGGLDALKQELKVDPSTSPKAGARALDVPTENLVPTLPKEKLN